MAVPALPPLNRLVNCEDLLNTLHALLQPLKQHTSPGGARVKLGHTAAHFDDVAVALEGFARPLWGAVPAGFGGAADGIDWMAYRQGLTSGVDPQNEEYWGEATDSDQRLVEMAPIGFAMALVPQLIYDPLSEKTKTQLQDWLLAINQKRSPNNNWHFFRVLVNLGLARVGAAYSSQSINESLERFEPWYLDNGWYSDGKTQQRDYYITFAIHFYSLVYAQVVSSPKFVESPLHDPVRAALYRERASLIAKDFIHWFDPDSGACIPFGRSLTYRFACASFWGAIAFANVELPQGLSWGVVKGVYLRNLRNWLKRPEIFNNDGTLSIGWAYPNLNMAEAYNSPGSPYWAMKAFIALAVPTAHPFWTENELPLDPLPSPHPIPAAHMIMIHSNRSPSHTYALASGQYANFVMRHSADKYGKLAYSATFGFCVPTGAFGLEQASPDCTLALSDDAEVSSGNGNHWRVRRVPLDAEIVGDGTALYARWDAWKDVDVRTWLVPLEQGRGDWHLRVHRIMTAREIWTCDGGFSVHGQSSVGSHRRLSGWDSERCEGTRTTQEDERTSASALVRSSIGTTGVFAVRTRPSTPNPSAEPRILNLPPNSSIMFPRVLLPAVCRHLLPREEPYWLVSGIFAVVGRSETDGTWEKAWVKRDDLKMPDWLLEKMKCRAQERESIAAATQLQGLAEVAAM